MAENFPEKMSEISIDVDGYHMPLIVPESTPGELLYLGSLMASGKKLDFKEPIDPFMQQIRQKAFDHFVQSLQSTGEYVRGVTGFKTFEGEDAPYGYRHETKVPKSEGWQGLINIGGDAEEDFKQFLRGENEMPNVMGREFPYTPEGMAAADNYRRAMGMRDGGMMGFRPLGYKDGAEVRNPGDYRISNAVAAAGSAGLSDKDLLRLGRITSGLAGNIDTVDNQTVSIGVDDAYMMRLGRIAAGVVAQNPGVSDRDLMMLGRDAGASAASAAGTDSTDTYYEPYPTVLPEDVPYEEPASMDKEFHPFWRQFLRGGDRPFGDPMGVDPTQYGGGVGGGNWINRNRSYSGSMPPAERNRGGLMSLRRR